MRLYSIGFSALIGLVFLAPSAHAHNWAKYIGGNVPNNPYYQQKLSPTQPPPSTFSQAQIYPTDCSDGVSQYTSPSQLSLNNPFGSGNHAGFIFQGAGNFAPGALSFYDPNTEETWQVIVQYSDLTTSTFYLESPTGGGTIAIPTDTHSGSGYQVMSVSVYVEQGASLTISKFKYTLLGGQPQNVAFITTTQADGGDYCSAAASGY